MIKRNRGDGIDSYNAAQHQSAAQGLETAALN